MTNLTFDFDMVTDTQEPENAPEFVSSNLDKARMDRDVKPELRVGKRTCQCGECDLFFTGVESFDSHQMLLSEVPWVQRCLTPAEMSKGGMVANKYGVWSGRIRRGHKDTLK